MLAIQLSSSVPLAEQVCLGIRRAIAAGELRAGNALPTVRQLANDLGINFNTVARAYRSLERQGLVRSRRGRGTRVTSSSQKPREPVRVARERLAGKIRDYLADARLAGLTQESVEHIIRHEVARLWPEEDDTK